jgi:hypothetical protein
MWPFPPRPRRAVVVLHIDAEGYAKGAFFRGDADVLIIDERDQQRAVYQMSQETPDEELRRRIGKHPLRKLLEEPDAEAGQPVLSLHWRQDQVRAH